MTNKGRKKWVRHNYDEIREAIVHAKSTKTLDKYIPMLIEWREQIEITNEHYYDSRQLLKWAYRKYEVLEVLEHGV